jgi:hypothetical protein
MMSKLQFRRLLHGTGAKHGSPIDIVLMDHREIARAQVGEQEVLEAVARQIAGPVAINVIDMEAVTTTSDGIISEGALVTMAAGDRGKVHREFGVLHMEEITVTAELIDEEPHLAPLPQLFPGRKLFRGPDPAKKLIPVHNVVMTGKAINNNSGTEMMNAVTMEEMLFPVLGQIQVMREQDILFGVTGNVISVGIGMTVAEKFGRVFPTRQFRAGETAHNCGEYAKTLKANIPCIVAPKEVLARQILLMLAQGLVPGRHLGCSPAVLAVAHAAGREIALDEIADNAWCELASIGITRRLLSAPSPKLSDEQICEAADEIIPGVVEPRRVSSRKVFKLEELRL